ncbi:NAD-binding protein [Rickenella mellea]|uniref:NAD-binding protein n=1 Tax=Rickenella mellea TaxID=50990 RepID=A0A4Y7QHG1_9AGAM|nr:NAD-binding protein [Rickenella mellea]
MGNAMWAMRLLIDQSFPPKSKFNVEDIPDLTGKIVIVTGGNTGVGKETIKALLQHNAKVYMASRSKEKAEEAIADLKEDTGKDAIFLQLDLASLDAVKKATEEFASKETKLHILFNNGGVMFPPVKEVTTDGYDLQFGTNVIGHFYFTKLLLPTLLETAKTSPDGKVRVVNTSSSMHMFANLHFDTFRDGKKRAQMRTTKLYAQSKLGNVAFARELARRYGDQGIVSTSLNPGNLKTDLQRHVPSLLRKILDLSLYPAPYGALTQLYAGTSPGGADLNGKYLIPWARVGTARKDSSDPETGVSLWEWLEEQVKDL